MADAGGCMSRFVRYVWIVEISDHGDADAVMK
jgi:hypothetical protein